MSSTTITGLFYLPDYISQEEEARLLTAIDGASWLSDLKRRVQHYGYRYDYKARAVSAESYLGTLPEWSAELVQKLVKEQKFSQIPDQLIVNEYLPGQGISPHVDCIPCFGEVIASLSLGSVATMIFTRGTEKHELLLQSRSLLLLTSDARYLWKHSIPGRRRDTSNEITYERQRRVSLTFRTVKTNQAK